MRRISLIPHEQALGQVDYIPRGGRVLKSLQMSLSSIAPIVCGMLTETLLLIYVLLKCDVWWEYVLFWYLAVSILLHMTLSKEDMTNLWNGIIPTIFVLYCVFLIAGVVTK